MQTNQIQTLCIASQEALENPVCQECLNFEVKAWLKRRNPELLPKLQQITKKYIKTQTHSTNNKCIFCRENTNSCPYCYFEYTKKWLTKQYPNLVAEFRLYFDFK